jgi:glycerol-3-phosphate dehydrogenase subunit C
MSTTPISYTPTPGLTYDPEEPRYWDPAALRGEIERAFDLCHGCRMCFKYCDSFPLMFDSIDKEHGGDVRGLTAPEVDRVADACFQCKLCDVQCPYTPRDKHEFQLDFPKLIHRHQAQRAKRDGVKLRDRLLADPDKAGALARASLGLANAMNKVAIHRWFLEKVLGIHRDKLLPDFAGTTFERWAEREGRVLEETGSETVLFPTCYVQNNEPQIGRDTLEVMDRNQVGCGTVRGLACCGMPAWEHGDLETLRANARRNLDALLPHVEAGSKVLAINPTCSMMLRREYPELVAEEDRGRARRLAEAVRDPSEFLWSIRDEPRFDTDFKSTPGESVAYHAPCHLRAQAIGFRGRDLLRKIPGVVPRMTMECCGHDGTFAMKTEGFEPSQRVGKNSFEGMRSAESEVWATDCPLAALQFAQHAGRKPLHPMTILARAYRDDGFERKVERAGGS